MNSLGYTEYSASNVCVCVCVPTTKQVNIVLEQGLRGYLIRRQRELKGNEQKCIVRSCMVCTGQRMLVGGELKDSGTYGTR